MNILRTLVLLFILFLYNHVQGIGHGDFRNLSFTAAFDSLYINFSTCYPFTEWKAIEWQDLYDQYAPQIALAQSQNDTNVFKMAIRRFIHSFPDGHVRVSGEFQNIFITEIGGGIGLTLAELEDGSIAVNRVISGSPAELVGIEVGAIILNWNGLPILESLANTDIIWEGKPPSTNEATRLAQLRRIVRMPIGRVTEIAYANPGQNTTMETLTAVNDEMETWDITNHSRFSTNGSFNLTIDDILNPVQHDILPSGYGYLKSRILVEFDTQGNILSTYNNIYASIKEAIDNFNAAHVPGVIIDVRDNPGGFDRLAALFSSFFYDHSELYEHASFYNSQTGEFEVIESFTIFLEPQESYYGGPVICLVNAGTGSSGEGIPMAIQRLSHGQVLGMYGTGGYFGLTSGETLMPGGLAISYPLGRSLDENYDIQIDSDSNKNGGIIPDVRVPLTLDNLIEKYVNSVDIELNYAIEQLNSVTSLNEENNNIPKRFQLFANYPNPFNPATTIEYSLPLQTNVVIKIYDLLGREIRTLVNEFQASGYKSVVWDGRDNLGMSISSGVYFYRIKAGNWSQSRKMLLIK